MRKFWMAGALVALMTTAAFAGGSPPNRHKNPVPEPVSMIALGAGALMLLRRAKKS